MWILVTAMPRATGSTGDTGRLVVLQAEDGDGIGVRHLPQAKIASSEAAPASNWPLTAQ